MNIGAAVASVEYSTCSCKPYTPAGLTAWKCLRNQTIVDRVNQFVLESFGGAVVQLFRWQISQPSRDGHRSSAAIKSQADYQASRADGGRRVRRADDKSLRQMVPSVGVRAVTATSTVLLQVGRSIERWTTWPLMSRQQ